MIEITKKLLSGNQKIPPVAELFSVDVKHTP